MFEQLSQLLYIVVLAVVGFTVATSVLKRRRKSIWHRFAGRHRLKHELSADRHRVSGAVDGRQVELSISPNSSDTGLLGAEEIVFAVEVHGSLPAGLELRSAPGVVGAIQRASDPDAKTVGDDEFDRCVVVTGDHPAALEEYLSEERRQAFLQAIRDCGEAELVLSAGWLELQTREVVSRPDELEDEYRLLLTTAEALDRTPGES